MDGTWLATIVAIVVGVIGYGVRWITAHPKVASDVWEAISLARIVVPAVEQLAQHYGWDAGEKFTEGKRRFESLAAAHGITITDQDIETIIEAAVKALRDGGNEIKRVADNTETEARS